MTDYKDCIAHDGAGPCLLHQGHLGDHRFNCAPGQMEPGCCEGLPPVIEEEFEDLGSE